MEFISEEIFVGWAVNFRGTVKASCVMVNSNHYCLFMHKIYTSWASADDGSLNPTNPRAWSATRDGALRVVWRDVFSIDNARVVDIP